MTNAAQDGPRILELRIHGIKNTPPSEMLGIPAAQLRLDQGDDEGGFWISTAPPGDPADPATPPVGVRREAYSWGAMARSDGGALFVIGQFFVQVAWLLLLPFGLCNTAYWAREIPIQRGSNEWRAGRGASSLRVFALGLTLLYVCALASVSLDLVGSQCLGDGKSCPALPNALTTFFDSVAPERGPRLAILSLLPLAGVFVLFLVSHHARMRYEAGIFETVTAMRAGGGARRRPLASDGFWDQARVGAPTEWLHLAASFLLVALLLGWDRVFAGSAGCGALNTFFVPGNACLDLASGPLSAALLPGIGMLAAAAGLIVVVVRIAAAADTVPKTTDAAQRERLARRKQHTRERFAGVLLAAAIVVFGFTAGVVAAAGDYHETAGDREFLGLVAAPSILLGALLAIAVSALGWRRGVPRWLSIAVVTVSGSALLVAVSQADEGGIPRIVAFAVAGTAALALLLLIVFVPVARRRTFRYQGWRGTGPGVLLLLSLGGAMILSTLLVLGVETWLETGGKPSGASAAAALGRLTPPAAFRDFGVILPLLALLLLTLVAVMVFLRLVRVPQLTTPHTGGGRPLRYPLTDYKDGRVPFVSDAGKLSMKMLRARRFAAMFHRGEPVLGFLAILLAVGFVFALTVHIDLALWRSYQALVVTVLGVIAVAAVVMVAGNAATKKERPLGVMWDLICFLPRAGHPFGPPCYAERVVPELRQRTLAWLGPEGLTHRGERTVIFSAHSLGGVLAVACLFTLQPETRVAVDNVGLLTYGTQLRVYFGRFWPELFGPGALGTRPQSAPSLWRADPWYRQVIEDHRDDDDVVAARARTASDADDPTLRGLLTQPSGAVAWFNLWRRTDYLGFPDHSHKANEIDSGADEFGPAEYLVQVATHPGYQSSAQYVANLHRMIDLL
ncbi:hypothetical protein [Leifsonia poae]|uniref:hypothetical protein n=1 Tax=Leifsonia poae TaxID=110933 RepID=UPI001CBC2AE3|nr:hypothetical protein [Leifsonia poae]